MKKKIKAGSVEELLEIVKAVQNGEEPEEALNRMKAESASLTDSPKSHPEDGSDGESGEPSKERKDGKRRRRFSGEEKNEKAREREEVSEENELEEYPEDSGDSADGQEDDGFEDDEFEKILEEDEQTSAAFRSLLERCAGGVQKISGAFGGVLQSRKKREKVRREDESEWEDEPADEPEWKDEPADGPEWEDEPAGQPGAEPDRENGEAQVRKDDQDRNPETESAGRKAQAGQNPETTEPEAGEDEAEAGRKTARGGRNSEHKPGKDEAEAGRKTARGGRKAERKSGEDEAEAGRKTGRGGRKAERESGEEEAEADQKTGQGGPGADVKDGTQPRKKGGIRDRLSDTIAAKRDTEGKGASVLLKLKGFWEELAQRGISRRELFMIGAVAALFILIIAIIVNSVLSFMDRRRKMEHVTADRGLTVTVEDEPEKWCASYPVRLGISADGISSVTVDGVAYKPDEDGMITVDASDYLLELSAVTQDGTRNAQIEIPMIDAQAPSVNVARDGDSISVSAADGRSGVSKVWYAEVHNGDYLSIPLYQEYTGTLTYEPDTTYYFYAADHAGNSSSPIVTTTETAESLAFAEEEVSLFPGDTAHLTLTENPEGALLNGLKFESSNPEIASVDENGVVTAIAQGSAAIRASANGVDQASCAVTVSDQQTVTISAVGDCTLGSDESFNTTTDFNAFDAVNGHSYFFSNVRDILENDDATFANFEGTLTTADTREQKEYAFKGDPSYTAILNDGSIDVVTLANNHSSDYGAQSLTDTKNYLTEAGIDYCTGDEIVVKEVNGIKTAFIGIYVLDEGIAKAEQVQSTVAQAKAQGAQIVIVAFHWGTEKAQEPDDTQISLAHTAVDSGASLVVGHHPHVIQGIEKYNGVYIAYSLGNFCFGGNSAPSDMDTIIFRQTFSVTRDGAVGEGEVEIIPCSVSSASGYNNYQPTPAQGAEAERIIGRLNEYSSVFGQTFEASTGLD